MRPEILKKIESAQGKQIDLRNLQITDQEIPEIISTIKELFPKSETSLEKILLSDNKISDQGAMILSKELSSFNNLNFLDLQNNQINKEGMAALLTFKSTRDNKNSRLDFALHGNLYFNVGELTKMEEKIEVETENKNFKKP